MFLSCCILVSAFLSAKFKLFLCFSFKSLVIILFIFCRSDSAILNFPSRSKNFVVSILPSEKTFEIYIFVIVYFHIFIHFWFYIFFTFLFYFFYNLCEGFCITVYVIQCLCVCFCACILPYLLWRVSHARQGSLLNGQHLTDLMG